MKKESILKKLKYVAFNLLGLVMSLSVMAQNAGQITGTVTEQDGGPLPGVTIVVSGTTTGTVSGVDGTYELKNVPSNATLVFSFVGMSTQEIAVKDNSEINVTMQADAIGLEEVVAVGYGTVTKRDLTGAVSSVKSEDLVKNPVLNVNQAIQGRAPGVYVSTNQSQPGGNISVRVRGSNSVQGDNEPLYIVDGFVGGDINSVSPNDIESVEILKDASSTAIYGSRGANGVVIITTKTGKAGKNVMNFDAYYGIQRQAKKYDLMNPTQYAAYYNELYKDYYISSGINPRYDLNNLPESVDWQDAVSHDAAMQNYVLSSSGGTDELNYYLSGGYIQQDGIIKATEYNRYNLRLNLDSKISDFAKIGTRLTVSRAYRTLDYAEDATDASSTHHPLANVFKMNPFKVPFDENGNIVAEIYDEGPDGTPMAQPMPNPLNGLLNTLDNQVDVVVNGNMYAELRILKNLKFRSTFGFDIINVKHNRYKPSTVYEYTDNYRNRANVEMSTRTTWLNENYFTYDKKLGEDKLNVVGGFTAQKRRYEDLGAQAYDFAVDDFEYHNLSAGDGFTDAMNSSMYEWSKLSFYGRVNYNINKKYLVTFNGRYDGSSKFAENQKWGFFPSGALAWRASEEPFIRDLGLFDNLKFRASYGISGSEALPQYSSIGQMSSNATYILNGGSTTGFRPSRLANPDLRWEQTGQLDIGFDAAFLNGRINMEADYYHKETKDLFLDKPIPTTNGVETIRQNIGSLMNEGIEFGINAGIIEKEFKWDLGFNITWQRSEFLDFGLENTDEILIGNIGGNLKLGYIQTMRIGEAMGTFYGYETDGVWQEDEVATAYKQFGATVQAGDVKFVNQLTEDTNGDGVPDASDGDVNDSDRKILGKAQPDFFGGINNTFSYKGFDLSVFAQYALGTRVLNTNLSILTDPSGNGNKLREVSNYWTPENSQTNVPRAGYNMPGVITDRLVEDASFFRIKDITLGYEIPSSICKKMHVSKLRLYVSGSNLLTFTKYSGYDPEVNIYGNDITRINTDNGSYPSAKSVRVGMNLTF